MTKTKIFTLVLWLPILGLIYLLYRSVAGEIELAEAIKNSEKQVVKRLMEVRAAEKAFLSRYGYYTSNWDSLVNFVQNDSVYITEKTEIIIPRERNDPRYYLGDSIQINIDTIGVEPVMKMHFPNDEYPNFNPELLPYVPGYPVSEEKKFEIFTDKIDKSGVIVDVIEVIDPYPMDESRSDENISPVRWRLRFGSRTEVTTAGNWE